MELIVHTEPNYLLEAIELVYVYVNKIPIEQLVSNGEYCVPQEETWRILYQVCEDLDPSSEEVLFFFRGTPVHGETGRMSFVASCLVYSFMQLGPQDLDENIDALIEAWRSRPRPLSIRGINNMSLDFETSSTKHFTPLSGELAELAIPTAYQLQLLDALSNYAFYLRRLGEILRPVVEKLRPLLAPWVCRAVPRLAQWKTLLSSDQAEDFLFRRAMIRCGEIKTLETALRFFPAHRGYVQFYEPEKMVCMLLAVGMSVSVEQKQAEEPLAEWESAALRLLSSADRIAMLNAMMHTPMSGHDLIRKLALNSGSVSRDLNSMLGARLILKESDAGRTVYRTNYPVVKKLMQRVCHLINKDDPLETTDAGSGLQESLGNSAQSRRS